MTEDQKKNEKLAALGHEVKDLHPILSAVFERMPGITNYEYTHGSREQGADYILERHDEVISDHSYIGVVVKSGDINSATVETITRQIRECKIPKNFGGGSKSVRITQFWVVTNGKIQESAKALIENEHGSLHIQMFPQHKLRKLIDDYYPNFWRNIPHEIGAKIDEIHLRVSQVDQQMDLLPVDQGNFYVAQKLYRQRSKADDHKAWNNKRTEIDLIDSCKKKSLIFVEGEYGYGKSKLLRETTKLLSTPTGYEEHRIIPHYVPFWAYFNEHNGSPDVFLGSRGFAEDFFHRDIRHVIFLDSLDESKLGAEDHIAALEKIVSNLAGMKSVCIVIASRPVSGNIKGVLARANSELLDLCPLSFHQVIKFIEKLCAQVAKQGKLIEDLKNSPLYKDLPRSPISAILLAKLLSENYQDIPGTLPELYAKYLELAMGRWDQKKGLQTEKEYRAVSNILMKLSSYFIENCLPMISESEAREFFISYTEERNRELDGAALFNKCLERSDILVRNPFDGTIMFKHRTYAEFLYALFRRNGTHLTVLPEVLDPYWSTIYYFFFGLHPDCPEMIDALATLFPTALEDRWTMAMFYPKYLLAASETEYKHVVPIVEHAVKNFVSLYRDSRDGKTEFPKGRLTKIQFLSLVTPFFRSVWGYKYFQNALEDVALRLELIFDVPEDRCCAAFFIGFARLGFDDPKLIDELVKVDDGGMPAEMQLVIAYEATQKKCRSVVVKKYLKEITRKLLTPDGRKKFQKGQLPADIYYKQLIR